MGTNRLFFSQDVLDRWIEEGKVAVEGRLLSLNEEKLVCQIIPAVLFLRESTGEDDPYDMVGRVKEERQLAELGADAYMGSAIIGDNAYDLQHGFVAVPLRQEIPENLKDTIPDESIPSFEELEADPTEELAVLLLQHLR